MRSANIFIPLPVWTYLQIF